MTVMRWSVTLLILVLFLAGCEPRVPLARGQVASIASNVCLADGLTWGEPTEILEPAEPDAAGHRWWQVRYFSAMNSAPRIIVVDDATGWGRRLPPGYAIRVRGEPTATASATTAAMTTISVVEGSQVLVLVEPAERTREDAITLEREAVRLNQLAGQTGLPPLFLTRTDAHDRVCLLYGWQADHGITPTDEVIGWVGRNGYPQARWVDLLRPAP